jgi:hypothetical protein
MMLRHSVLFLFWHRTTEAERLLSVKGLAYLTFACPNVRAGDFGRDMFGGSARLTEVKPWDRPPLWRAGESGPPSNYDMALHLDFDDEDGLKGYNECPAHSQVSDYHEIICRDEFTARVDWWYDGPPRYDRGKVRHTSMYLFEDGVSDGDKESVREALRSLQDSVPGVYSVAVGDNIGKSTTGYDLIADVLIEDTESAEAYFGHPAQREVAALAAGHTLHQWTARATHLMGMG